MLNLGTGAALTPEAAACPERKVSASIAACCVEKCMTDTGWILSGEEFVASQLLRVLAERRWKEGKEEEEEDVDDDSGCY